MEASLLCHSFIRLCYYEPLFYENLIYENYYLNILIILSHFYFMPKNIYDLC